MSSTSNTALAVRDTVNIKKIVELLNDSSRSWSYREIAEELGFSTVAPIRRLMDTPEFQSELEEYAIRYESDPRRSVVRQQLVDLLPTAVTHLTSMLASPATADTIRWKIIEYVLSMNGIRPMADSTDDDLQSLRKFLHETGVHDSEQALQLLLTQTTHIENTLQMFGEVPDDFAQAMQNVLDVTPKPDETPATPPQIEEGHTD